MTTHVVVQQDNGPYWGTMLAWHRHDADAEGAVAAAVASHLEDPIVVGAAWRVIGWDLDEHDQFDVPDVWWKHGGNRNTIDPDVVSEPPFIWFDSQQGRVVTEPCRMDELQAGDLFVAFDGFRVQVVDFPMGDIGDRPIYARHPRFLDVHDVAYPTLTHDDLMTRWATGDSAFNDTGYGFYDFEPHTVFRRIFEFDFAT